MSGTLMQVFEVNAAWRRCLAIGTVLFFASSLGCHALVVRSPAAVAAVPATPDDAWRSLENRLLDSLPLRMRFHVTSEGVVASDLRGTLVLQEGGLLELSADGQFAGQPQALRLSSNGVRLRVGSRPDSLGPPVPPTLGEAVVIGLTRMGILHNLARLTRGALPDHMEGGVRDWLHVDSLAFGPPETLDGRSVRAIDYRLVVSGSPSGTGRLILDALTRRPVRRTLTVRFPQGQMFVTERYELY